MVVVEAPEQTAPASTEAGPIRDARLRQARRRRRAFVFAGGLVALGLLAASLAAGGGSNSNSTGDSHTASAAIERARRNAHLGVWRISPALEGGRYGWCIHEDGGGSCSTLPTESSGTSDAKQVAIGTLAGTSGGEHEELITTLLSSSVTSVLADGQAAEVVMRAQLPYGLRLAQIVLRSRKFGAPQPQLLAVGANGKRLGYLSEQSAGGVSIRWWKKPSRMASGPCQIRAHGLPALEAEWGHVAAAIRPYPAPIIGRAFFSCADTEYYMDRWPLETAILLDAQHPGRMPAAIPGMKSDPGAPGVFNAPGDWHGDITAVRHGRSWLVVAGGSGLSQRIDVLRHLSAKVTLG